MNNFRPIYDSKLLPLTRDLRKNLTDAEKLLWKHIRRKQILDIQFYRQKPIGNYIVDFFAPSVFLVIELDGSQHFIPENIKNDRKRTEFLNSQKLKVLRFTNTEVLKNTSSVLNIIFNLISTQKIKNPSIAAQSAPF